VDPAEHEVFHDLQRSFGQRSNGNLDRNRTIWEGKVSARHTKPYAYVVGPESEPVGYVVFHQKEAKGGFDLHVRDMAALTPAAWRRLFTLLGDHRSLAKDVYWDGPSADPRLALLPDVGWRVADHELWMLRIVDVAGALSTRGYPSGLEAELAIEIEDDVVPENAGRYRLAVHGGAGEVGATDAAGLRLDVRALASLYTGLRTASELRDLGKLRGDDEAVAAADRIFAGPEPWMPDHF
jgi:predicted acetyltransferase